MVNEVQKQGYIVMNTQGLSLWQQVYSYFTRRIPMDRRPTIIHGNEQAAFDQATRLADQHGCPFVVFKAYKIFQKESPLEAGLEGLVNQANASHIITMRDL